MNIRLIITALALAIGLIMPAAAQTRSGRCAVISVTNSRPASQRNMNNFVTVVRSSPVSHNTFAAENLLAASR